MLISKAAEGRLTQWEIAPETVVLYNVVIALIMNVFNVFKHITYDNCAKHFIRCVNNGFIKPIIYIVKGATWRKNGSSTWQ